MAKVADVFGRLEAFSFSILLYVIGYIQMALSSNVQTYGAAQIFYSAGNTGLQILQQIFIADTSDLPNRAFWSSLPDTPFLITVWIGSIIGNDILKTTTWRWGYAIWAIILPVMFIPLALSLFLNNKKAKKAGLIVPSPFKGLGFKDTVKKLWSELDVGGIILLSAAFALILIPLTIASKAPEGWRSPSIIAMIVIGFVSLIGFLIWESREKLAPRPLIPLHLLKSRSFCAGCGVGFFYFMVFYLSVQPYFYSYLLVVQNQSITSAGHITQTFSFSSTIAAIAISFVIKYTNRYKPFVIFGVQASAEHQHVAVVTAVYLTAVEIGGAVGSAISGAIWSRNIPGKLAAYLPESAKPNAINIYNNIDAALSYAVGTPEREAINQAYQETMRILLIIALCIAVPVLLLSLVMKDYKLKEMEQGVKGRVIGGNVEGEGEEETKAEVPKEGSEVEASS